MIYLKEAYGEALKESEKIIRENNILYLEKRLNQECYIAIAEENRNICACAYFNVIHKAANLRFVNGMYGEIYGVYTMPEYRRRGIATKLIKLLLEKGREFKLSFVQLEASDDGYDLYKKIGFKETESEYKKMKYSY